MAGEGLILRKAREEKGWTYSDIEDSIKIRVRYLEALENEDYNILPGTTYSRGFLRTYSKYLGLNPEELIGYFNSSLKANTEAETHPDLKPIQNNPVWFNRKVLIVMAVIAVIIVVGIILFTKMNNSPKVSDYTPAPLPTTPQISSSANQEQQTAQPPAQTPVQPPVKYEGVVVEISFSQDCWLKYRVDGGAATESMNAAGTKKTIQGSKKVQFITIGNAGGIVMKVNGVQLQPLGASREAVWDYVITLDTVKSLVKG